ncbi:MAG: UbiA family prenyltransferase [Luteolibacter sp.]|uniref:UbiA family prenyltransferase n=1 Tax=Luteolibacter sp. TaxID=1962973 RepID=UPI003263FE34
MHALLSTARVANVPSVVSNVWVGVVLGIVMRVYAEEWIPSAPWVPAGFLAVAGVLLYIGGNFFNDWMDHKWDAEHRPERALPRGLFPTRLYAALAVCLMGAGVTVAGAVNLRSGMVAGGIVFWIIVYTVWHKRSAWAVVPMGMCRALLPVMGFLALLPKVDSISMVIMISPVACGLFAYIMGLSLSARYESMAKPPMRVGVMSRGLLLMTAVFLALGNRIFSLDRLASIWGVLPYLVWTGCCLRFWRKPVPKLVSGLLAGIPLVDWMVLLPVAATFAGNPREGAWHLAIVSFAIPPLAFVSALLLQRLAPAT